MKSFLIYFKDKFGYDDDTVIRAYNETEATIEFYKEYGASCKIIRIC